MYNMNQEKKKTKQIRTKQNDVKSEFILKRQEITPILNRHKRELSNCNAINWIHAIPG